MREMTFLKEIWTFDGEVEIQYFSSTLNFVVSRKDPQKTLRLFRNIKCAMHNLAHKIVTFVIWFQRCEGLVRC